ncbi:MAG: hypothetical protein NC402_05005 [Prevotella sp.]|nr:hypothetical protein [Prevotella sp.]MCM1074141.1 hypothetical protein [Ruminococcus sp.]
MNRLSRLLIPTMLTAAVLCPGETLPQHRGTTRPTQTTRPGGTTRPSAATTRPATNLRPTNNSATRPAVQQPRPNTNLLPGGNTTRPNHNNNHKPGTGAVTNRPGNNHSINPPHRPNRPTNPGRPGNPGGNSVHKPGGWASAPRPHFNYRNPGYRPPRPGGGYWGVPAPNPYRIRYWAPPVPRYVRVLPSVPSIGTILGLTFGSFIDAGINTLFNAGYNIAGYYDNAIYLTNVRQLGFLWPEVMVQYNDGLMNGTQFYNWSATPDQAMYYNLYNQLTARYGNPVDVAYSNSSPTATWWAGGNTGYITLSYGYGPSASGMNNYYTSLTYTAY